MKTSKSTSCGVWVRTTAALDQLTTRGDLGAIFRKLSPSTAHTGRGGEQIRQT